MKKIFIGSSSECLDIARAVQLAFSSNSHQYFCIIWNQNVFEPNSYTIPTLINKIKECDYAIFVFGEDDVTTSRGKKKKTTRDNVVYECGLATGILGYENCFVLKAPHTILPSDFDGLTVADYDHEQVKNNATAAVGQAVTKFEMIMTKEESDLSPKISWDKYVSDVKKLCNKIRKSPRQGGFRFDIIIGISRGGIITADLINRKFLAEKPLACLWGDYKSKQPDISFNTNETDINKYILEAIQDEKYKNILVVDDITRRGKTIVSATTMLKKLYPEKTIECAVLYLPKEYEKKVKYYAELIDDKSIAMPYAELD